jgi:hypothetical protein
MTARTRTWVVLSALGLLSLDLALVAVAAPMARGWLDRARTSALVRVVPAADCPSSCPAPSCPPSGCPKNSAPQGTASGWSSTGLPTSMMGVTLD